MPNKYRNSSLSRSERTSSKSRSRRAGLVLPVGHILKLLKDGEYARRIGPSSAIYLAAIIEYILAEVLELAGNAARDCGKMRICPRHLLIAIRRDEQLAKLLHNTVISKGGFVPTEMPSHRS